MTTPNQSLPDPIEKILGIGAYVVGGGDFKFGQGLDDISVSTVISGVSSAFQGGFTGLEGFVVNLKAFMHQLSLIGMQLLQEFLPPGIIDVLDDIESAVDSIVGALGIDNLILRSKDILQAFAADQLKACFTTFTASMTALTIPLSPSDWRTAVLAVVQLVKDIAQWAMQVVDNFTTLAKTGYASFLTDIWDKLDIADLKTPWNTFVTAIEGGASTSLGTWISAAIALFQGIGNWLLTLLNHAVGQDVSVVHAMFASPMAFVHSVADKFWGGSAPLQAALDFLSGGSGTTLVAAVKAVWHSLKTFMDSLSLGGLPALSSFFSTLSTDLSAVAAKIAALISGVGGAAIADVVTAIGKGVSALSQLATLISNVGGTVIGDVSAAITSGVTALARIGSLISGVSGTTIADVVTAITDARTKIAALIAGLGGTAIADVVAVINAKALQADLLTLITTVSGKALQADLQTLYNNLFDAFNGTTGSTGKTLANVLAICQAVLTSLNAKALQADLLTLVTTVGGKALQTDLLAAAADASSARSQWSAAIAETVAFDAAGFGFVVQTAETNAQGSIDAGINALKNTTGAAGQDFGYLESTLAGFVTSIFNKFGGNSSARASVDDAAVAMETTSSTVTAHSVAITALQAISSSSKGLNASVMFQQPETAEFSTAGSISTTLAALFPWFTLGVDSVDKIEVGAGGGGSGGGVGSTAGSAGGTTSLTVDGVATTAAGGAGGSGLGGSCTGHGPGNQVYNDLTYLGGASQPIGFRDGHSPGAGGAGSVNGATIRLGGGGGTWATATATTPASGTVTGTVGAGGTGGAGAGGTGGDGGDGAAWLVARPAIPSSFTVMGTQILPTWRYNVNVALTDDQTAVGIWDRTPPNGASGGVIVKLRSNTAGTNYVYLYLWDVSGTTYYRLGYVSGGTDHSWRTGTVSEAIAGNAWSLSSSGNIFSAAVNGAAFDAFNDSGMASSSGTSFRSGSWASSETTNSIQSFAFLDSGAPSSPQSASVVTSESTSGPTYGDLATTGPSVTLSVTPDAPGSLTGTATVTIGGDLNNGTAGDDSFMSFAMTGANTRAASDQWAISTRAYTGSGSGAAHNNLGKTFVLTGLNIGATVFEAKYRVSAGAGLFQYRDITATPWNG